MNSYSYQPYSEKSDSSNTSFEQPLETEAFIQDDGQDTVLPVHRRKRYCSIRGIVETFLVLVTLAEALYILYVKYSSITLRPFGPPLPEKIVTFGNAAGMGPDLVYADPEMFINATRNNEIHENWQALFPKGRGYVVSPYSDPWEHAYPPMDIHGVVKDWQPAYILSVYHQLHCLSILASRLGTSREQFKEMETNKREHTSHCIEYLRQSILCSADTSMEGETGAWADAGWGQKHVCKDYDALMDFAEGRSAWDLSHSRHPNITGDPTDRGKYDLVPETGH